MVGFTCGGTDCALANDLQVVRCELLKGPVKHWYRRLTSGRVMLAG